MSFAETPALTDTERILQKQDRIIAKQAEQTAAINSLGTNVQWLIDQANGIFQMFSSPAFMNQMLSGGIPNGGPGSGPEAESPSGPVQD